MGIGNFSTNTKWGWGKFDGMGTILFTVSLSTPECSKASSPTGSDVGDRLHD